MPRLFAAIDLPGIQNRAILSNHSDLLGANWEKQPHITLVHFGEVAVGQVNQLTDSLHRVSFGSFDLHPTEVGFFGEPTTPSVMWIGLAPSNPLQALHHELFTVGHEHAFPAQRDEFVPHITLAHIANVDGSNLERYISSLDLSTLTSFPVGEFHLYQSANGTYARLATTAATS